MDAHVRFSWIGVVLLALATPLPVQPQTPKPVTAPPSSDRIPIGQIFGGPFNINRTLICDDVVSGLTPAGQLTPDLNAAGTVCGFEVIRTMPVELTTRLLAGHAVPTRKTYALSDLSDSPELGAWIAAMIPKVVQPGTWEARDPYNRGLSYFAPAKILLVYHTPAAHAEIEDFLQSVKQSLPHNRSAKMLPPANLGSSLTQAQHTEPRLVPSPTAPGATPSYPVPPQARQPRHLFHFIIRYEGDGVIDANIVEFAKAYSKENSSSPEKAPSTDDVAAAPVYAPPLPTGAILGVSGVPIPADPSAVPAPAQSGNVPAYRSPASRTTPPNTSPPPSTPQ